jgi:hypothetical protein
MEYRVSKLTHVLSIILIGILLAACQPSGPLHSFTQGEQLAFYDFSNSSQFEQGAYDAATLLIRNGVYRIDVTEGDNELWWGQWGDVVDNVVIDVDVNQLSQRNENAYGIMCRVRGRVGLPVDTSDLTFTETTQEATIEATVEATELATEAATAEATDEATREAAESATEAATTEADATEAATEAAPERATEAATEAAPERATDEATEATDEATEVATDEATREAAGGVTSEATPETLDEILNEATERAASTEAATAEATVDATAAVASVSEGDGYLFLMQGSGSAAIMRARGRNLTPLVNWQTSDKINVGPSRNHLRAVCVGDYLAFYINDALVAEATDDTFQQGQVGLVASAANRLGTRVEFDDLTVAQAIPG